MANRYRGEINAELDGKNYNLCLTLGALAELEDTFGEQDLLSLAERFSSGRIKAGDALRIIGAGLRGAGSSVCDDDVANMQVEGGAAGYVSIVARLLTATFGEAKKQVSGQIETTEYLRGKKGPHLIQKLSHGVGS
jgi:hypothetical protein